MTLTKAVFDSSPLIFLDTLGYIPLLPKLFEVWVTPTVLAELTAQPGKAGSGVSSFAWLDIAEARDEAVCEQVNALNLDVGEASVIALALETGAAVVLDDGIARKRAGQLGLSVVGTIGILMLLQRHALSEGRLEDDLKLLIAQGMWLDEAFIADILSKSG
ncbi:MAG: hypothetical protein KGZ35_08625 [Truepera sp.]|nr:hypothetical protein [Truepera sp.]